MYRRTFTGLAMGLAASVAMGGMALGEDVAPSGPINLVVPFAAGGATDLIGRIIAQELSKEVGQTVLVENIPGAGGALGAGRTVRSDPDGTHLLLGTVATHVLQPLTMKSRQYDPEKDFTPISMMVQVPIVLLVNKDLPVTNVKELVELLKADPDKYVYGSSGVGTPLHLSGELFKTMAGVKMEHVPYPGGAPAMTDLIGGQIPIFFEVMSGASSFIKDGSVKALAVTTKERLPGFPDIPTIDESGVTGYETYTWNAVFGPPGLSAELVKFYNEKLVNISKDEGFRKRVSDVSAIAVGSTPEELATEVAAETAKWTPIAKSAGL